MRNFASAFEGLEIGFRGRAISTLTATKLVFWNHGSETIRANDIATKDPLIVRARDSQILDAKVLQARNTANGIDVSVAKGECTVQLEYLDRGDGAVIQLLHTAKSSGDLEMIGRIKGAGQLRRRPTRMESALERFAPFGQMLGTFPILYGVFGFKTEHGWGGLILFEIMGVATILLSLLFVKSPVPKHFAEFRTEVVKPE